MYETKATVRPTFHHSWIAGICLCMLGMLLAGLVS
jgi:hypothetical protein